MPLSPVSMRALLLSVFMIGCGSPAQPVTPAPTAKTAPKPLRAGKSAVLFVVDYEALLPIGCFDQRVHEWRNGERCLDIVPDDADIELEGKRITKRGSYRVPSPTECALTTPLLMFEGSAAEKPGTLAVWPPGRRVERVEWPSGKVASVAPATQTQLGAAMSKLGAAGGVKLVQATTVDLDGDGAPDSLLSATTADFDPGSAKGIAALFYGFDGKMTPIRTSEHAVFRVEAITDLDDDGLPEVFASERTFHSNGRRTDAMTLAHWSKGGMEAPAALESCWPPSKAK